MRKAADILYLVGSILCFVGAGFLLLLGLAFAVLGGIQIFQYDTTATAQQIDAANKAFLLAGVILLVFVAPTLAGGIIGMKAGALATPGNDARSTHVLAIVFGAIASQYVLIAAGVLGVILSTRKPIAKETIEDAEVVK